MSETSDSRITLICTLGTGDYKEVIYTLEDQECRCWFSPIAVAHMAAGGQSARVVALLTEQAEQKYGAEFSQEVAAQGWEYKAVRIPRGQNEAELWQIFESLGDVLEPGMPVILDPTHSLRSTGIVLIGALNYYRVACGLGSIKVFYGAYEVGVDDPESGLKRVPVFDLTPAIALAEWTYGLQVLRDYQLASPLAQQLEQVQISARHAGAATGPSRLQSVARSLRKLDPVLRYAFPLEIGLQSRDLMGKAEEADMEIEAIPPMRTPWAELKLLLRGFMVETPEKTAVQLARQELDRQARIIDSYLSGGNVWAAYALIREWIVSALMLHLGSASDWLDRQARDRAESHLNAAAATRGPRPATVQESRPLPQALVNAWSHFRDQRNDYAHAGMNPRNMSKSSDKMRADLAEQQRKFTRLRKDLEDMDFYTPRRQPDNE